MYKKKVRRFDAVLRRRLCEMAGSHVRYGYRRLTVLLRREGWKVNAKRIYRLYTEQLIVRTKQRRKMARRQRGTIAAATAANQCWSMDFMSDKLADGSSFRILTVVDQFTRECVCLEADRAMTGMKVAQALERAQHYGRQWQRVQQSCPRSLGDEPRRAVVLHSTGASRGERIHRKFQWAIARRVFERGMVRFAGGRGEEAGKVPPTLQSRTAAQCLGRPNPRSIRGATQAADREN